MDSSRLKIVFLFPVLIMLLASCSTMSNSYSYNSSRLNGGAASRPVKRTVEPRLPTQDEIPDDITDEEYEKELEEELDFEEASPKNKASEEALLRLKIVDYAQDYLGTKYVYGGKTPAGFDCSGFVYHVLKKYDVNLPGSSSYQSREGVKVNIKKAKAGDLIFFRKTPTGKVFHVAMVVENNDKGLSVIHSTSRGVVIDNISTSQYWEPKISIAKDVLSD
jgi:cell wall-associated NlpC family hydrolase